MNSPTSEKITFPGAQGHTLAARLEKPIGQPRAYALFAHCFTCSKDIFAASRIASELSAHGIAVLRFDFTGLGSSEGEFANTNFSSNVGDLVAAARYLEENLEAPKILIGHSLGGAAVLAAAAQVPSSVAIATIGAPSDPGHVAHLFDHARQQIEDHGEAEVTLGGRQFKIQKQFIDDISENNLDSAISGLQKALLVFHAPLDGTVGIENAGYIFQAAKHPKSFVSLDDADHLLSRRQDSRYVAAVLASWAMRYIGERADDNLASAPGHVVVAENAIGKFSQSISINDHHQLYADEPESYGGNDSGPSPYDLLLAGLGACTAMTLRMYAQRKGIALEHVSVNMTHGKIHAEDCADCHRTSTGMVDHIDREIEIIGDMDTKTRQRLLEIADKCPVHKTLHSEVMINSCLKD